MIYKEQLSCHDSLLVEPKQPLQLSPQLNQCHDFVSVPEQSSLVAQEVGSPIAVSKHNPVITKIVTLTRKKQDALPKKARSKNKKVALPKMAVANPFIVKLKIARNTNKKAKVHECIIDKDKVKPFETVFARQEKRILEKRRILLQKKTFNSSNKKQI